jgi:hypothetical protein
MARLTKEDIESGKIKLIRKNIIDKNTIIYDVIYEISDFRYSIEISDVSDDDQLKAAIYETLLTLEKETKAPVNNSNVEFLVDFLGQNVTAPKDGGDGGGRK